MAADVAAVAVLRALLADAVVQPVVSREVDLVALADVAAEEQSVVAVAALVVDVVLLAAGLVDADPTASRHSAIAQAADVVRNGRLVSATT